jgi:hypothetical protein
LANVTEEPSSNLFTPICGCTRVDFMEFWLGLNVKRSVFIALSWKDTFDSLSTYFKEAIIWETCVMFSFRFLTSSSGAFRPPKESEGFLGSWFVKVKVLGVPLSF